MGKYSFIKERNGKHFRYNYGTDNLEYVIFYHGEWTAFDWISVDRRDWKSKWVRNEVLDDFSEMIDDANFGAKYNVKLEDADFGAKYNIVVA
jgi:hypothetical protein